MKLIHFLMILSLFFTFCKKTPRVSALRNSAEESSDHLEDGSNKTSLVGGADECKAKGSQWTWDEKKLTCTENITFAAGEAACKIKGTNWTWNDATKQCLENITLVQNEAACQAKGAGWAYVDQKCVQQIPAVTSEEQCTAKGTAWAWKDNLCSQTLIEISNKQQCEAKDQKQWKWVADKADTPSVGSCMEISTLAQLAANCTGDDKFWNGEKCLLSQDLDEASCEKKFGKQKDDHWLAFQSFSHCSATKEEKDCLAQNNVTPALNPLLQYSWGDGTQVGNATARTAAACFKGFCAVKEAHVGWDGKEPICKKMFQSTDPTKAHNYVGAFSLGTISACAVFGPYKIPGTQIINEGRLQCWGNVTYFKSNDTELQKLPSTSASGFPDMSTVSLTPTITGIALGRVQACGIFDHKLYCWGAKRQIAKTDSNLIDNDSNFTPVLTEVTFPTSVKYVRKVVSNNYTDDNGYRTICAVVVDTPSNKGKLYCWGYNLHGLQNGLGVLSAGGWEYWPRIIGKLPADGDVIDVSLGAYHACAIVELTDKTTSVWCWGHNAYGRVNANNTAPSNGATLSTTEVPDTKGATKIACGASANCALVSGKINCWGNIPAASSGAFAAGFFKDMFAAETTTTFSNLYAGRDILYALHNANSKGIFRSWGRNEEGQAGQGVNTEPRLIGLVNPISPATPLLTNVLSAATNLNNSVCAVEDKGPDADEELYCWGRNDEGILGNGGSTGSNVPIRVSKVP